MDGSRQEKQRKMYRQAKRHPIFALQFKKILHKLYIRATGGTYYPQALVGLTETPSKIMENIGWWLQHTEQGMWMAPLQNAEDITCLGWLLYSVDEYDRDKLTKEIWSFTGVRTALRFREIDDSVLRKPNQNRTP